MKVLIINGSPRENGTTARVLKDFVGELNKENVESEIVTIGKKEISGCIACGYCKNNNKCYKNDLVNEIAEKMKYCDGLVIAGPVYYSGINGTLKSLLDRLFRITGGFPYKPGAGICVARRGGTTAALEIIEKYFTISNMPIVSSQYWNMVHGLNGEDVESDVEGMQTVRLLAKNMAWLIKCIEAGRNSGIEPPKAEEHIKTNFVR